MFRLNSFWWFAGLVIILFVLSPIYSIGQSEKINKNVSWGISAGGHIGGIIHASSFSKHEGSYLKFSWNRTINERISISVPISYNSYNGIYYIPIQAGLKFNLSKKKLTRICFTAGYGLGAFSQTNHQVSNFTISGRYTSELYIERLFELNPRLNLGFQIGVINQSAKYTIEGSSIAYEEINNLSSIVVSIALFLN